VRFVDGNHTNLSDSEPAATNLTSYIAISAEVAEDRVTICDVQDGSTILKFILADLLANDVNTSSIAESVQKALDENEELRSILGTWLFYYLFIWGICCRGTVSTWHQQT